MFSRMLHGVVVALFFCTILLFVGWGVYVIIYGTPVPILGHFFRNKILNGVLIMVFGVIISFALWGLVGTFAEIGVETRKTRKLMQELVDMNIGLPVSRYPMGLADPVQNPAPDRNRQPVQNPAPMQNRQPVQNPAPMQNRQPVQNPAPMQNRQPMQNQAPIQNAAPMQNVAPVQNPMPMQNPAPMQDPGPAQNRMIAQNPAPMQDTAPAADMASAQAPAAMQNTGVTQNLMAEESGMPARNDNQGIDPSAVRNENSVPDTDGQ